MNPLEEKKEKIRELLKHLMTPSINHNNGYLIDTIQQAIIDGSRENIDLFIFGFEPERYNKIVGDNESMFDVNFTLEEFKKLFEEAKAAKQVREAAAAASIRVEPRLTQSFRDKGTALRGKEVPRRGGRNKNIKKSKNTKKSKRTKKSKGTKKSKKAKK
jgi:hypothetical protein